ncbi:MAG: HAMP domain-containing histidine kinase [Lachnospiraceae bacterium]|nr:HAMP domain-containing histidine kinase [Lachnospiraceae bacterium]
MQKKEEESTVKNEPAVVLSSLLPPPDDPDSTEPSIVNIVELANAARNELMESAKKANLHVSVSCIQETLLVRADANRLKVLFKNIIDNSIKYMNKPGSLVITISSLGDDIFIVLKDTGEGLAQKETKHIFELNYQGSNRLSGNGLGLAQAKAIVEYYGGTIYAKSTVGGGMGIYIQLPA